MSTFEELEKKYDALIASDKPTRDDSYQSELSELLEALREFGARTADDRPSRNEELDDVPTHNIGLLSVPYLIAELVGRERTTDPAARLGRARFQLSMLTHAFLFQLRDLGALDPADAAAIDSIDAAAPFANARQNSRAALTTGFASGNNVDNDNGTNSTSGSVAENRAVAGSRAVTREEKVSRALREREVSKKIDALRGARDTLLSTGADASAEERDLLLAQVQLRGSRAVDAARSVAQEVSMLEAFAQAKRENPRLEDDLREKRRGEQAEFARRAQAAARGDAPAGSRGGLHIPDSASAAAVAAAVAAGVAPDAVVAAQDAFSHGGIPQGGASRGVGGAGSTVIARSEAARREELMKSVFRPFHLPPTMSLEEFAQIEVAEALERQAREKEAERAKAEIDSEDEAEVDKKTYKAREWDAFKDDNPRGAGNTKR